MLHLAKVFRGLHFNVPRIPIEPLMLLYLVFGYQSTKESLLRIKKPFSQQSIEISSGTNFYLYRIHRVKTTYQE